MIGLGRMGGNIVRRLMKSGHTAVVYDKDPKAVAALAADGAVGADSLEDFIAKLTKPRTAWVMLPAGKITEATIDALAKLLPPSMMTSSTAATLSGRTTSAAARRSGSAGCIMSTSAPRAASGASSAAIA